MTVRVMAEQRKTIENARSSASALVSSLARRQYSADDIQTVESEIVVAGTS